MSQSIPSSEHLRAPDEVIFSLKDGQVWASWHNGRPAVNLGDNQTVAAMMASYLKQEQLAERLLRADPNGTCAGSRI